jgi:hypothetical protein
VCSSDLGERLVVDLGRDDFRRLFDALPGFAQSWDRLARRVAERA